MGFLDTDEVVQYCLGVDPAAALQQVGQQVTQDMLKYTRDAAQDFYGSYSPRRYQRAGDLANVGKPVGPTSISKWGVYCGATADDGPVSSKPAYQWGRIVYGNPTVSGSEIFSSAWESGRHGAWYTAATTQSPDTIMAQYMVVEVGKIGGYIDALFG